MKNIKKFVAVICSIVLLLSVFSVAAFADESAVVDYTINNPYANVNWDTYSQYKADFHSHTTASDGSDTLKDMLEEQYRNGFDIVAVTDHGVVDYGWTEQKVIPMLSFFIQAFKDRGGEIVALSADGGTAANGNTYSLVTENGSDYYYQTDANGVVGHRMMRVPYGNENNPTSINNAHVNTWFVDYGHAVVGGTSDYITPISNVDALGGLSVINHPGEYSNARDEVYTADAYNYDNISYRYTIDKFAGLLTDYPTCLGIDVNSKADGRTRFDRKLWDILLQKVVPTGRNVLGLATSDAHSVDAVYTGYTMMCMEENTVENLKNCMQEGAFFAASKCLGNYDEIKEIADLLVVSADADARALGNTLVQMYKTIEQELADGDQGTKYVAKDEIDAPVVTGVAVDNAEDTITLTTTDDAMLVRWIANGKLIATGNSIDLNDYSNAIGSYVRAEIFGEGGIVYTQAFTLEYDGAPAAEENDYIDLWYFASVIPDTIVKIVAMLPIFDWLISLF